MTPDNAVIGPIAANNGAKGADMVPLPLDQAREFARHSKAENTLRGYRADWRDFWGGARRTRWVRCLHYLRPWRLISPNAPAG